MRIGKGKQSKMKRQKWRQKRNEKKEISEKDHAQKSAENPKAKENSGMGAARQQWQTAAGNRRRRGRCKSVAWQKQRGARLWR